MATDRHARAPIQIERVDAPTDDVCALVGELEAELAANYMPEQRHGLAVHALFQPHIRFFIARRDGWAIGCGGVALFQDFAEIKRMYVRPEARSRAAGGVADAIMAQLTAEACNAGRTTLRLETGTQQIAAIRFYQRCGFTPCQPFEPYASMPAHAIATSVFMEKQIAPEEGGTG